MQYDNLSKEDIKILKKMGYPERDLYQIDRSIAVSTFGITQSGLDKYHCITAEQARKLLGNEEFLASMGRSAFHWNTSREIKNTGYEICFDSRVMFTDKASDMIGKDTLEVSIVEIQDIIMEGK